MLTPSRLVYERMKVTHGLAHARTRTCMTPLNGIDTVILTAVVKFQVRQVQGQTVISLSIVLIHISNIVIFLKLDGNTLKWHFTWKIDNHFNTGINTTNINT